MEKSGPLMSRFAASSMIFFKWDFEHSAVFLLGERFSTVSSPSWFVLLLLTDIVWKYALSALLSSNIKSSLLRSLTSSSKGLPPNFEIRSSSKKSRSRRRLSLRFFSATSIFSGVLDLFKARLIEISKNWHFSSLTLFWFLEVMSKTFNDFEIMISQNLCRLPCRQFSY